MDQAAAVRRSARSRSRAMSRAWPAVGEPSSSLGVSTTTGTPATEGWASSSANGPHRSIPRRSWCAGRAWSRTRRASRWRGRAPAGRGPRSPPGSRASPSSRPVRRGRARRPRRGRCRSRRRAAGGSRVRRSRGRVPRRSRRAPSRRRPWARRAAAERRPAGRRAPAGAARAADAARPRSGRRRRRSPRARPRPRSRAARRGQVVRDAGDRLLDGGLGGGADVDQERRVHERRDAALGAAGGEQRVLARGPRRSASSRGDCRRRPARPRRRRRRCRAGRPWRGRP